MLAILLFVVVLSLTGCPGATATTPINQAPMTDPAVDLTPIVPLIKPMLVAAGYWALCDQCGSYYSARMIFSKTPTQMHDCQVAMWAPGGPQTYMFPGDFLYRSECQVIGQKMPGWWLELRRRGTPV